MDTRKTVVFYDGECPLCTRLARCIKLFDWLKHLRWVNFRDPKVAPEIRKMLPQDANLEEEMYVVSATGAALSGFAAWRAILMLLPVSFLFAWVLYLPGVRFVGTRIYRYVSRNRFSSG